MLSLIFVNAPINPVGVRINLTALESATYSRFRDIASWTSATTIGARIAKAIPIIMKIVLLLFLLLPRPVIEDQKSVLKKICEMIAIIPTKTAVNVMKRMS